VRCEQEERKGIEGKNEGDGAYLTLSPAWCGDQSLMVVPSMGSDPGGRTPVTTLVLE
jgi:hypothetical protein